jgi:prevent-host-death family protein
MWLDGRQTAGRRSVGAFWAGWKAATAALRLSSAAGQAYCSRERQRQRFKAKCLALIDRAAKGEEARITKRGRVVARLVPDADDAEQPWRVLRGKPVVWHGDPFAPAVDEGEIEAER